MSPYVMGTNCRLFVGGVEYPLTSVSFEYRPGQVGGARFRLDGVVTDSVLETPREAFSALRASRIKLAREQRKAEKAARKAAGRRKAAAKAARELVDFARSGAPPVFPGFGIYGLPNYTAIFRVGPDFNQHRSVAGYIRALAVRDGLADWARRGRFNNHTCDTAAVLLKAPAMGKTTSCNAVAALRDREAAFNEDQSIRPSDAREPSDFYAFMLGKPWRDTNPPAPRALPRMQEQPKWVDPRIEVKPYGFRAPTVAPSLGDSARGMNAGEPVPFVSYMKALRDALVKRERPANLNAFAAEVHRDNAHWWHDPATGAKLDRNMGEMLMLVVSEIAECMEGERKDLMDTHLPHRKMAEVELADAVIRIADIAGAKCYDISGGGHFDVPENKGHALSRLCRVTLKVTLTHSPKRRGDYLGWVVAAIEAYAKKHGYDLWGAVADKREYNKHRADHKPAARLAAGGKKW